MFHEEDFFERDPVHNVAAGSPSAADLAPAYNAPVAAPFNWTGFYVGIEGGGGGQYDSITGKYGVGGIVGGQIGYNYQINALVVGLEGEGFGSNIRSRSDFTAQFPGGFSSLSSDTTNSLFDVAVRFGFTPFERALLYGKLGAVWANQSFSMTTNSHHLHGQLDSAGRAARRRLRTCDYQQLDRIARIEADALWFKATDVTLTGSHAIFIPPPLGLSTP